MSAKPGLVWDSLLANILGRSRSRILCEMSCMRSFKSGLDWNSSRYRQLSADVRERLYRIPFLPETAAPASRQTHHSGPMSHDLELDSCDDSQYDGVVQYLHRLLIHKRPRDPLLCIHQAVEERMEQRDSRRLSESGVNLSPPGGLVRDWSRCGRVAMLGIDVGGSLSKITFFERDDMGATVEAQFVKGSERYGTTGVRDLALSFKWHDGTFHFLTFETRRMEGAIEMLRRNDLLRNDEILLATGGGAYKFSEAIRTKLGLRVVKGDELHCLLWGLNFILQHTPDECYYLANPADPSSENIPFSALDGSAFPYLLVNIGSGVSILKVDNNNSFQRISGTMMGGGTFWGLCRLLTDCQTFEEAVDLASQGKSDKLNMLVGDIYGGDYEAFGLRAQTVASAFGNVGVNDEIRKTASHADIARGLLDMIAQNIAQLAYLCARKYNLTRIIFAGNFLRKNRLSMSSISFSIDYWSNGVQKALFLKHEGYFGSTGAFFMAESEALNDQVNRELLDLDTCSSDSTSDLQARRNLPEESVQYN